MKDKADYARKGIARGRSVVVLQYDDGILFVAENPSPALHKISEIYDRIAFAAVGRYNEFENLREAGVRFADMRGFRTTGGTSPGAGWPTRTRRPSARSSPTATSRTRSRSWSPRSAAARRTTRSTGSRSTARSPTSTASWPWAASPTRSPGSSSSTTRTMPLADALAVAVEGVSGPQNGERPEVSAGQLEVAVLDRGRPHRKFRRLRRRPARGPAGRGAALPARGGRRGRPGRC